MFLLRLPPAPAPNNAYVGALALNVTVFGEMASKDLLRFNEVRRAEALTQQDWCRSEKRERHQGACTEGCAACKPEGGAAATKLAAP